jgi:hypothetical protein
VSASDRPIPFRLDQGCGPSDFKISGCTILTGTSSFKWTIVNHRMQIQWPRLDGKKRSSPS